MPKKNPIIDDLRTAKELVNTAISDFPSDSAWIAITVLQYRGSKEEYDAAIPLLNSGDSRLREIGVHIIGQLGWENVSLQKETVSLLIDKLRDQSASVVAAAATALGHRHDSRSVPYLLELRQHADPDVRLGVVLGLSQYDDREAVDGLIELSRDIDDEVRNWATFALGSQINIDTPSLREALFQRLQDDNSEIRGEALVGLARRKDERVMEAVAHALEGPFDGIWPVEAAQYLADPIFYPRLVSLKQRIKGSVEARFVQAIDEAIYACKSL